MMNGGLNRIEDRMPTFFEELVDEESVHSGARPSSGPSATDKIHLYLDSLVRLGYPNVPEIIIPSCASGLELGSRVTGHQRTPSRMPPIGD